MPLIFQSTAVARPAFYDRNPTTGALTYGPTFINVHAITNRTSLTVPVNKKAWLDSLWVEVWRSIVSAGPGDHGFYVQYTPNGGAAGPMFGLHNRDNNLGAVWTGTLPTEGFLNPGDLVQVQTFDSSSDGQNSYTASTKYTLFDP